MDDDRLRTLLTKIEETQDIDVEAPPADVQWVVDKGLVERQGPLLALRTMHGGPRTDYSTGGVWSHILRLTPEGERKLVQLRQ